MLERFPKDDSNCSKVDCENQGAHSAGQFESDNPGRTEVLLYLSVSGISLRNCLTRTLRKYDAIESRSPDKYKRQSRISAEKGAERRNVLRSKFSGRSASCWPLSFYAKCGNKLRFAILCRTMNLWCLLDQLYPFSGPPICFAVSLRSLSCQRPAHVH